MDLKECRNCEYWGGNIDSDVANCEYLQGLVNSIFSVKVTKSNCCDEFRKQTFERLDPKHGIPK